MNGEYWKGYGRDTGNLLSQPRRWERRDWLTFAGLTAGCLAIRSRDAAIKKARDGVQASITPATERLAEIGEKMGSLGVLIPGLLLGHGLGWAARDAKLKEATLLGFEALLLSAGATRVLKHAFSRARPYTGLGPDEFRGPYFDWTGDYDSWPSGHTTVAFAVATAFHLEYRKAWVSVLAYSLAGLGGWSRIHDDKHWASDVFAGATVGTVIARGIFRARRGRMGSESAQAFISPGGAGVAFRF